MSITRDWRARAVAALLAWSAVGVLAAQETPAASAAAAPRSGAPVEQRLHQEVQAVLLRLIGSGELSAEAAAELTLAAPASQQPDFGAILDVRYRAERDAGLPVLGVTPGSSAATLGLQAGDTLTGVNGVSLSGLGADERGHALAATRLREQLLAESETVTLQVRRGDAALALQGPVRVVDLPAYRLELGAALAHASLAAAGGGDGRSRCGRISTFDIAPRTQKLYRAVLIAVDGRLPGPSDSEVFRVAPGRHVLTVAEAIDWRHFSGVGQLRRDRRGRDRYRKLEVEVQPGITYRLAARFHVDARHRIEDNAYWEPVIWKESPEPCR